MADDPTSKRTTERIRISDDAVADALEMLPVLTALEPVHGEDSDARPAYDFADGPYDFPYALGFLLAGDHALSAREVTELLGHLRVLPDAWRTMIYRGGPDPEARGLVVASRDGSGKFNVSTSIGITATGVPAEPFRRAAGATRAGSIGNEVVVTTEGSDLIVEIKRSDVESSLLLHWWTAGDDDDFSGSVKFLESRFRAESLVATVGDAAGRRAVVVIADGPPR